MFSQVSLCFTSLEPILVASDVSLPSAYLLSQRRCTAGGDSMCTCAQQQRGAMHWRHGGCLITTATSFLMMSERHVLCACQVAKRKSSEKCYMYRLPSSLSQVCSGFSDCPDSCLSAVVCQCHACDCTACHTTFPFAMACLQLLMLAAAVKVTLSNCSPLPPRLKSESNVACHVCRGRCTPSCMCHAHGHHCG